MAKSKKTKVMHDCCAPVCADYKPRLYLALEGQDVAQIKNLAVGEEVELLVTGKIVALAQRERTDGDKKRKTGDIDLEGYRVRVMGEEENPFKKMADEDEDEAG